MEKRKRILLLSVGGTIASAPGENGLVPELTPEALLYCVPEIETLDLDIRTCDFMKRDSTNIGPEQWQGIARAVFELRHDYSGFVITHGTDTMGYTAAALSFMLRDFPKPVVLTGSQIPMGEEGSDAPDNLLDAFRTAALDLPGVYVVFHHRIIAGTHAVKVKRQSPDAFMSVNYPQIGEFRDGGAELFEEAFLPGPSAAPVLEDALDPRVVLVKLSPGFEPEWLSALAEKDVHGVVIEGFGCGGLPMLERDLLPVVKQLTENGVAVVLGSQVLFEKADIGVYEVGVKAKQAGAIEAGFMTAEALVAKLMWVLAKTRDPEQVKVLMETDVAHETL